MIRIRNLKKSFGDLDVLNDINLDIAKGEIYGIVGRSGAGKSTLLRCINGLEKYDSGSLEVEGTDVGSLSASDLRKFRKNVGVVFQNFSLVTRATVYENIALAMKIWNVPRKEIEKRVDELLETVELTDKKYSKSRDLSGGQKQRVAIARALAMNPDVLLCDEATSALDPKSTQQIIALLKDINKKYNITIVVVTHEMDVVKKLCDSIAILEGGILKSSGSVQDVFRERSLALRNLIGNDEYCDQLEGCAYEITYTDSDNQMIVSEMIRKLDIDISIIRKENYTLKNGTLESLLISSDCSNAGRIEEFLSNQNIQYSRYTK